MRAFYTVIGLLIVVMSGASAQDTSAYKSERYISGSDTLNYRIMYPDRYDVNKKYPVILFLHGSGERGNDNEAQLKWGSTFFADSATRKKFPAFVIFPQCPATSFWAKVRFDTATSDALSRFSFVSEGDPMPPLGLVEKLIDSFARSPQVDTTKIYVGGLSMGGMGTFELLWRKPHFFAAAFPICGGGDPAQVKTYARNFPIWVFHGGADPVVNVELSRRMVKALKAAGAKVLYTEYPGVGHDSWNNVFRETTLLPWLFQQKL